MQRRWGWAALGPAEERQGPKGTAASQTPLQGHRRLSHTDALRVVLALPGRGRSVPEPPWIPLPVSFQRVPQLHGQDQSAGVG